MYKRLAFIIVNLVLLFFISNGQTDKRNITASRLQSEPTIDGLANEGIWDEVQSNSDFLQFEPYNGRPSTQKSSVKFAYTDNAIFVFAHFYDSHTDSIIHGLCTRDNINSVHADILKLSIDPFNDGVYAYEFFVTASGVQGDQRVTPEGNSLNWDAVWKSEVSISQEGWFIEMKIPFSALRFPNTEVQNWGVNVWRLIRRNREWSTLNYIDNKKENEIAQAAILRGIEGVKPPLRLALYPYISSYAENPADQSGINYSFNYGADLKYGINESFTLDLTLIPDFGQVESDDEVLNLSPFEVRYNEKRQFFTEGTELFNKGGVFYSRRIGGTPQTYYSVNDSLKSGESVKSNPDRTNIINAVKVSGRTKKGLGIGAFNAMTVASHAVIEDSSGNERIVETQGFTNYNVMVVDQTLRNNSFVSIINTNVKRKDYMADVSGINFSLSNKSKTYGFGGNFLLSQQYHSGAQNQLGYMYAIGFSKTSGKFRFSLSESIESDTYDPNDLGFLQANNSVFHYLSLQYNQYNPFWKVHFWYNELSASHSMLYKPNDFTDLNFEFNSRTRFKNHLSMGANLSGTPISSYDYYESRMGLKYAKPPYIRLDTWISPDYRKTLAIDVNAAYRHSWLYNMNAVYIRISPRIRFNDKFMLIIRSSYYMLKNDRGYASILSDSSGSSFSIFGRRDNMTITNSINADYIFNNKSSFSFRLRHNWSTADYHEYFLLQDDGSLVESTYNSNHDINYNAFTIDMSYTWQFAPGSELSVVWKNAIINSEDEILPSYLDDLRDVFNSNASNSISIKLLYYLDYHYLEKKK